MWSTAERVVLVTGGSAGIGRSTVTRLARAGARVVTCARGGDRLAEALAALPERAVVWRIGDTAVALDPELADDVVTRLKRAGITARIVEA